MVAPGIEAKANSSRAAILGRQQQQQTITLSNRRRTSSTWYIIYWCLCYPPPHDPESGSYSMHYEPPAKLLRKTLCRQDCYKLSITSHYSFFTTSVNRTGTCLWWLEIRSLLPGRQELCICPWPVGIASKLMFTNVSTVKGGTSDATGKPAAWRMKIMSTVTYHHSIKVHGEQNMDPTMTGIDVYTTTGICMTECLFSQI